MAEREERNELQREEAAERAEAHEVEDGTSATQQQAEQAPQAGEQRAAAEDAAMAEEKEKEIGSEQQSSVPPADVYDLLRFALGLFLNQAWIHLGVRTAPGATETVTDLSKARVAIDTAVVLFEKLRSVMSEQEQRDVELELSNLRINFAQRA